MATRGPKGAHDLQVGPHNGHEDRHQERLVIPGSTPELPSSHLDLNNGREVPQNGEEAHNNGQEDRQNGHERPKGRP